MPIRCDPAPRLRLRKLCGTDVKLQRMYNSVKKTLSSWLKILSIHSSGYSTEMSAPSTKLVIVVSLWILKTWRTKACSEKSSSDRSHPVSWALKYFLNICVESVNLFTFFGRPIGEIVGRRVSVQRTGWMERTWSETLSGDDPKNGNGAHEHVE